MAICPTAATPLAPKLTAPVVQLDGAQLSPSPDRCAASLQLKRLELAPRSALHCVASPSGFESWLSLHLQADEAVFAHRSEQHASSNACHDREAAFASRDDVVPTTDTLLRAVSCKRLCLRPTSLEMLAFASRARPRTKQRQRRNDSASTIDDKALALLRRPCCSAPVAAPPNIRVSASPRRT